MRREETFFWYDLETFGLHPQHDRIAQFAGVRTTMDLQIIEDPVILYCKLSDDYLPDPLACMVTGITPQQVMEKGLCETEFIGKINELFSRPGTCVAGYNSLRFDDEFIRNALFRNFIDPYKREYDQGNSRWDIIDLVRAAHDLRPQGINWPRKPDSGKPSFKLTDLTEANGISHQHAHDATSDVLATIELARLIKKRQPKLFDYYFSLRSKQQVKKLLAVPLGEPVLLTSSSFTRMQGCSSIIVPITAMSSNSNSIIIFDLSENVHALISASEAFGELQRMRSTEDRFRIAIQHINQALSSEEGIQEALKEAQGALSEAAHILATLPKIVSASDQLLTIPGVYKLAINKVPCISPLSVLTEEIALHLGIDRALCEKNYQLLLEQPMLPVNIRQAFDAESYPASKDVDFTLYSGSFFQEGDVKRFALIRTTPAESLWSIKPQFDDVRGYEMFWRYICRNYPHTMDDEQRGRWNSFCAQRLIHMPSNTIVTVEFFARKIAERMASKEIEPKDKEVLSQLALWGKQLCDRIGLTYPKQYS